MKIGPDTCAECVFWVRRSGDHGECHGRAPESFHPLRWPAADAGDPPCSDLKKMGPPEQAQLGRKHPGMSATHPLPL
jgi:hypothetical protein